ncbi:hypothetical protein [Pararhizobium sp. O133]
MAAAPTMTLDVVQFSCTDNLDDNLATASRLIRRAALGANVIVATADRGE